MRLADQAGWKPAWNMRTGDATCKILRTDHVRTGQVLDHIRPTLMTRFVPH
ncbi:hypothetical protein [Undibacterium sp. Ren11W]|uniref:hypothetical protein n=1 Tax=Undibacterium sp. Ren11W TaxID=3413045 RepID=UPI003BF2DCD6